MAILIRAKRGLLIGGILMTVAVASLAGCSDEATVSNEGKEATELELIHVYTSFYPLYDFAAKIGGDAVKVRSITPPGAEPHDFEPSPKDMVSLADADLFVYNGSGFEPWAEQALKTLDGTNTRIVNATEHLDTVTSGEGHFKHSDDEGEHVHTHSHGERDPHVWLDPNLAKQQAQMIKDALVEIDADRADVYEANFEHLAAQFDELDQTLRNVTQTAEKKEFVVSHAAFGHLAHRYGLEQVAVSGLSPSDEPSSKELQQVIDFAKEHDVHYIMFDVLVSPKVANAVKESIGAEVLRLHSLENLTEEELGRGEDYFSIMEQNIANLEKALNPSNDDGGADY